MVELVKKMVYLGAHYSEIRDYWLKLKNFKAH